MKVETTSIAVKYTINLKRTNKKIVTENKRRGSRNCWKNVDYLNIQKIEQVFVNECLHFIKLIYYFNNVTCTENILEKIKKIFEAYFLQFLVRMSFQATIMCTAMLLWFIYL